jgi:hypothetical protein
MNIREGEDMREEEEREERERIRRIKEDRKIKFFINYCL